MALTLKRAATASPVPAAAGAKAASGAAPAGLASTGVFVSYSRKDREFVRRLHDALRRSGRDVWVDWEDIPPSAEWLAEIERGIESADTFVFVLSPDSVSSQTCGIECAHAAKLGKRIVPVVARDVRAADVAEPLRKLNWLFFRPGDDFDAAFAALLRAIDTDLAWVRAHSRLLVRAREWETHGNDASYLIGGTDLDEAETWLAKSQSREPAPMPLQIAYVTESRRAAIRLQKNQLRGFYIVSLVYATLQVIVSYLFVFDSISETGLMALSPLWVVGLVFGGFGLTLGRTSLRRSLIVAVLSGVGLWLFFVALWPML
jgi:hypothetical protein